MYRFRALLLALSVITITAASVGAFLAERQVTRDDEQRSLAAADRVAAIDEWFERARAITILASRESVYKDFYAGSGTVKQRMRNRPATMRQLNIALGEIERLYPEAVAEVCLIDRGGQEIGRVMDGKVTPQSKLGPDDKGMPFFPVAFGMPFGTVHHSQPYVSMMTGEWVMSNTTQVKTGKGPSRALLHFEVTVESFRKALRSRGHNETVRLVDLRNGAVIADSETPQQLKKPLGQPQDRSLLWVKNAENGTTTSSHGQRHTIRLTKPALGNENRWAVVVSTPAPSGIFGSPTSPGPIGIAMLLGIAMLVLSILGYVRHSQSIHRSARLDDLTMLPNRLDFRERLSAMLDSGTPTAVLLLDLNRFKEINDTLGHAAGDALLLEVGRRLKRAIPGNLGEVLARLGGDEFVVAAPDVRSQEHALVLAGRIETELGHPMRIQGVPIRLSGSIGVALAPAHAAEYGAILRCADIAMYASKQRQGQPVVYDEALDVHSANKLGLDAQLLSAVRDDELEILYQPIYDVRNRTVSRFEALVRWNHPMLGILTPGDFIPLAEETGFIRVITRTVLTKAVAQLAAWRAVGINVALNVNISSADLRDATFASEVEQLLAIHGVPPRCLTLELTESALLINSQESSFNLKALTRLEVGLAIDDFGTGYSSLAQLRLCPATQLKIDRSLVSNMVNSPVDALIVRSTIELGQNLGLVVIAEGVEDAATFSMLHTMGCTEVQGFLFTQPRPPEEARNWLHGLEAAVSSL